MGIRTPFLFTNTPRECGRMRLRIRQEPVAGRGNVFEVTSADGRLLLEVVYRGFRLRSEYTLALMGPWGGRTLHLRRRRALCQVRYSLMSPSGESADCEISRMKWFIFTRRERWSVDEPVTGSRTTIVDTIRFPFLRHALVLLIPTKWKLCSAGHGEPVGEAALSYSFGRSAGGEVLLCGTPAEMDSDRVVHLLSALFVITALASRWPR